MVTRSTVKKASHADDETRRRLIAAAGHVFAARGFRDATVREICTRAGANVASVNYHFGDKAQLYSQTLRHLASENLRRQQVTGGTPAEQLRQFVHAFFQRIFSAGADALYGEIIAREMIEPTHALKERVDETMKPLGEQLRGIMEQLRDAKLDEQTYRQLAGSVVGQIVFYKHCRAVIDRMMPGQKFDARSLSQLADHVTAFSIAGIRAGAPPARGARKRKAGRA